MPSLSTARRISNLKINNAKTVGEISKENSDFLMEQTFENDIQAKHCYIYDYFNRKKYYDNLFKNLDGLDKKYFIAEILESGDFIESNIIYSVLEECTKSMKDEVADLKRNINDYKEYIETWVHEIKTPIASARLILENDEGYINKSVLEEIEKVEGFIEQVLFYSRKYH